MEIKRKLEMSVATDRQYIIRQSRVKEDVSCSQCGEDMLSAEQTAVLFSIKQREIFQFIEGKTVHFAEIEGGVVMICLSSLAKVLEKRTLPRQGKKASVL